MVLTVQHCDHHLFHTLGGPLHASLPVVEVINDAGEWLAACQPWKWLQRPSTTMSFVADQNYITLPTDLQTILAVELTNSLTSTLHLTGFDELIRLRTSSITPTLGYWGAVAYPSQTSSAAAPAGPRLELYPTPSASETGAITIFYRAGWTSVKTGSDAARLNIPEFIEPLYKQVLRAYGRAYELEDVQSLTSRLEDIQLGALYKSSVARDGTIQLNYGEMQGGAAQYDRFTGNYLRTTVQGPS